MTIDEKEMRELLQEIVNRAYDTNEHEDVFDLNDCINEMKNMAEKYLKEHPIA